MNHHNHLCTHHSSENSEIKSVLIIVFILNILMFFLEFSIGQIVHSSSLQTDSFDFLGDSISYLITFAFISSSAVWKNRVAVFKAFLILILSSIIIYNSFFNFYYSVIPSGYWMIYISILALIANAISAFLLYRFRKNDSNMHSIWVCSRNDAINNLIVIIAAIFVLYWSSNIPDLIAALFMLVVTVWSIKDILKNSILKKNS